jgi:hypothetical protein
VFKGFRVIIRKIIIRPQSITGINHGRSNRNSCMEANERNVRNRVTVYFAV